MTALALAQTKTALGPGLTASFLGVGGTGPYIYSVSPGGAGGTIDSASGIYTAPIVTSPNPAQAFDTIVVTDATTATASSQIMVGMPLLLLCEIIQNQLDLDVGRVYLWDQKIMQFSDNDLYVAISVPRCKPFGNTNVFNGMTQEADQFVSMWAEVDIDVISRGPAARDRKEEVILALATDYCQQQQVGNSFYISRLSNNFVNLSNIDGAAIPYRYKISIAMQYAFSKNQPVPYFDNGFFPVEIVTEEDIVLIELTTEEDDPIQTEDGDNLEVFVQ